MPNDLVSRDAAMAAIEVELQRHDMTLKSFRPGNQLHDFYMGEIDGFRTALTIIANLPAAGDERCEAMAEKVKTYSDTFDAIWDVCVECGMEVHPPQLEPDEFGETCEEEYANQFGFIRDLAAKAKELHLLKFGVATLVERFHHWSQTDGDMGWAKGMREASEELAALISPPEQEAGDEPGK